ncbi:MAG TPA: 50S ribosomal protein L25 [Dehalococcoidia bacterium]|jgi:large subunit ribosomal protein L25|nr:50S ribosomal protein L25 [Dehalococcoidia bacterium]
MERPVVEAQSRQVLGKKVRSLRRAGLIPANLYGHGIASMPLQVPAEALRRLLARAGLSSLISLRIDGGSARPVFIRGVQRHPLSGGLLHVDFYQVRMDEPIRVEVPLVFVGQSPAAKGPQAMLVHNINTVEIEGLPGDLPHHIEVDLSGLEEIDQAIHVRDLPVAKGIAVRADPETVVVKVARRRGVEEVVAKPEAEQPAEEEGEES